MNSRGLREFGVSEDGRTVTLSFATDEKQDVVLTLNAEAAGQASVDLISAVSLAMERSSLATQGVVSASTPTRYRAGLAEGEKAVLISFQMPNGLQHHFAFPTAFANQFRLRLNEIFEREISSAKPTILQ